MDFMLHGENDGLEVNSPGAWGQRGGWTRQAREPQKALKSARALGGAPGLTRSLCGGCGAATTEEGRGRYSGYIFNENLNIDPIYSSKVSNSKLIIKDFNYK